MRCIHKMGMEGVNVVKTTIKSASDKLPFHVHGKACAAGDTGSDEIAVDAVNYSLFRDVDRVRLVTSIINRHLNLQALIYKRRMKGYFGLHNDHELERLKNNWALHFDYRELWGSRCQPLLEIRWSSLIRDFVYKLVV